MKRLIAALAIIVTALALSGCMNKVQYRSISGDVFETSEEAAAIMAERDMYVAHQSTIKSAFESADTPEKVVAANTLSMTSAPKVEGPKHWSEKWLPWAQIFSPHIANLIGGKKSGDQGANSAGINGNNRILIIQWQV